MNGASRRWSSTKDKSQVAAVACSSSVLEIVLSNLVRNAVKYIGYGGGDVQRITVRVRERSALLANHGLVTIAATPAMAPNQAEVVEHSAQVALGARILGGYVPLPPEARTSLAGTYRMRREHPA